MCACNLFAVIDISQYVNKLSQYLYYCNWRRLCNLNKERKILQTIFGRHYEFAHHYLMKLSNKSATTLIIKSENNLKVSGPNKTYKTKFSFKTIYNLNFRKCNGKKPSCPIYMIWWIKWLDEVVFMSDWSSCSSMSHLKTWLFLHSRRAF